MDYFSRHEISNSDLSELLLYFSCVEDQSEPVEAYRFGRLIDFMITEPEKINYFNYTADDEQYTREEFDLAYKMLESARKDRFLGPLLPQFVGQKIFSNQNFNIKWGDFSFDIPVRCKYDLWSDILKWGCDIKSTTATTLEQFEAACWHFWYPRQRSWYMDISGAEKDMLVGISKKNYQVFKIPIDRKSKMYIKGRESYSDLAFKWYSLFYEFNKE
jgi:hypothetical protein